MAEEDEEEGGGRDEIWPLTWPAGPRPLFSVSTKDINYSHRLIHRHLPPGRSHHHGHTCAVSRSTRWIRLPPPALAATHRRDVWFLFCNSCVASIPAGDSTCRVRSGVLFSSRVPPKTRGVASAAGSPTLVPSGDADSCSCAICVGGIRIGTPQTGGQPDWSLWRQLIAEWGEWISSWCLWLWFVLTVSDLLYWRGSFK